jgi:hypothetical protein
VVNNTDRDWAVKVSWVPEPNSGSLYLPGGSGKELMVPRKTTIHLPVCFKPAWVCKAGAKLTLNNPVTLDQFEYEIKALGE